VLSLGGLDAELGLSAGEVAAAIGLSAPNSHKLLAGLEALDALERVPDERPIRWRRDQA
jgi:DNA-binding IclR family transcriptional regulator